MSELEPKCPSCGSRVPDWLLCRSCTDRLERDLTALPELMRELRTTYTRQSQAGTGNGGKGAETALVFDENAATVQDEVINTIGTWIREMDLGDTQNLAPNMRAWCRWLLDRINRIRGHAAGGELVDEIADCVKRVKRAIDRPADRLYCGKCDVCQADMWARQGEDDIICQTCKNALPSVVSSYSVDVRRSAMLAAAADSLATRSEILTAVPGMYGVPINGDTFQTWVKRGRLADKGTRDGQKIYRLGDALDLARDVATRKRTA